MAANLEKTRIDQERSLIVRDGFFYDPDALINGMQQYHLSRCLKLLDYYCLFNPRE